MTHKRHARPWIFASQNGHCPLFGRTAQFTSENVAWRTGLSAWGERMRRREFVTLFAGAAATWPLIARAQSAMPVIGHLGGGAPNKPYFAAFQQGLKENGYVEGQSVAVEERF